MNKLFILILILSVTACTTSQVESLELHPNTLREIKVVKNWEPVTNFTAMQDYTVNTYKFRWSYNDMPSKKCTERLTLTNNNMFPNSDKRTKQFAGCQQYYHDVASKNPQIIADVLLAWASNPKDKLVFKWDSSIAFQTHGYQISSVLGTFSQFYAIWYDQISYTPQERNLVDAYMTKRLMAQKFPVLNKGLRKCNINRLKSIYRKSTGANNCGNIRKKVAVGEIMLGFRLEAT